AGFFVWSTRARLQISLRSAPRVHKGSSGTGQPSRRAPPHLSPPVWFFPSPPQSSSALDLADTLDPRDQSRFRAGRYTAACFPLSQPLQLAPSDPRTKCRWLPCCAFDSKFSSRLHLPEIQLHMELFLKQLGAAIRVPQVFRRIPASPHLKTHGL